MAGIRADQLALYTKDMYKAERETYKEMPTVHDRVFKVVSGVKGAGDKMTQILGAGSLERHTVEGQDINFKSPVQGWEYLVKYWTFSDGLTLTKEAVADTVKLGNLLKELASTWGISVRVLEEEFGAGIFNDGGTTAGTWRFNGTHTGNSDSSGNTMYDSECLFNLTGNTRSNKSGTTFFNSTASLEMTPANFEIVYNNHVSVNNRDERSRVVQNPADTVLCPPGTIYFKADRIFGTAKGMPSTDLNDKNPYYGLISEVIAWDYLTDYTAGSSEVFYVGKRQSNAFQYHKRQLPEIRFFNDEANRGAKASIDLRMGILLKDFRPWSRGGGASA